MTVKKVLLYLCGGIIACSDEKSKTFVRVEFNAKDKMFVVNGSVMRTPEQTNKG